MIDDLCDHSIPFHTGIIIIDSILSYNKVPYVTDSYCRNDRDLGRI